MQFIMLYLFPFTFSLFPGGEFHINSLNGLPLSFNCMVGKVIFFGSTAFLMGYD